jgi:hypothetical protein
LLVLATAAVAAEGVRRDPGPILTPTILVLATSSANAGATHCVTVIPAGGEKGLSVSVELNGVPLPKVMIERNPDGTLTVCYHVPAAASGGKITLTVTSTGGNFTTCSFTVP